MQSQQRGHTWPSFPRPYLPSPQLTTRHSASVEVWSKAWRTATAALYQWALASRQDCRTGSNPGSSRPEEDLLRTALILPQLQDQGTSGFCTCHLCSSQWEMECSFRHSKLQMLIHKQLRACPAWTALKGTLATQQLHTDRKI